MPLCITNTMSGRKESFVPLKEGAVNMYVCGVTVYDRCHIGHARALLTFDVIYRYLRFLGFDTRFVRNFTDVDDKIINRAREEGIASEDLAQRYIDEFHHDAGALGLLQPTLEPRATGHIPEMIAIIASLVEQGKAYEVAGDVYFAVQSFSEYGKLSGRSLEEMMAGARIEVDDRKRHPMDFALWKASKEGEPFWDSPWGRGRPGWHIECSAMSTKYLGQPFDIHGGGQDLVFPHNENEIAQSECAAAAPFARYWIHNGFVQLAREKMSKSVGNILSIREVLERYDPAALRLYMLTTHYRNPIEFSEEALGEAQRSVARIYETAGRGDRVLGPSPNGDVDQGPVEEFRREMDDDFNTPRALAVVFEELRAVNRLLDRGETRALDARCNALRTMTGVLGLIQAPPERFLEDRRKAGLARRALSEDEVRGLIKERNRAREIKDWQQADDIREALKEKGVLLKDGPSGTTWELAE
ncbi:MAG: cysteine--tRNA ligase [Deltaproteobacteria bacterium]|nr:cysteine--tRNA ligase [Deltaproteobacteria bacterium]